MSTQAWRVGVSANGLGQHDIARRHRSNPAEVLAWDLIEYARPVLDKPSRTSFFVALGAGESEAVIVGVLRVMAKRGHEVPPDLLTRTATWLDGYVGAEDEGALRELLGRVAASITTPPTNGYEESDGRRQ